MPIVCGIHPVLEALAAGSRTIERVVVTKGVRNKRILEVIRKASERGVPLRFEPREALDRAADGERHQGVLAIVAEKGLLSLEELQKSARSPALFMLLDGVEDPRNLGAIIRSVDASGADGVILPDRHTASLSDAAARTAAGALESVRIARIGNVVQTLETLKAKGFWIVGFDGSGKERWDSVDFKRPIVLVLGGEGKGIRRLVKEHCDHIVSLPVFGQVSSLNVSVAAGIALYEAVRQRGSVPTMARPIPPRALAVKKPVVIGPPPGDREEDPGALRRAAAIASLSTAPEPVADGKPEIPGADSAPAPLVLTMPVDALSLAPESDITPPIVKEASIEELEFDEPSEAVLVGVAKDDDSEADETRLRLGDREDSAADDDDAAEGQHDEDPDLDENEDDETDADDDREDDADDREGDDDQDDDEDDEDEDGGDDDEADGDEEEDGDEDGDDDDEDDEDGDEEDDDDEEEGDEDEDQGDEASDLATPFMPEDNSGGGEVTWGSEKELHAHRPRREGERRFSHKGAKRSGRPGERKKRRPAQGNGGAAPGGAAQGPKPPRGEQGRGQAAQSGRGAGRNGGPRPPQEGSDGTTPQNRPRRERPSDGATPDSGAPQDQSAPQEGSERRPGPSGDGNRSNQARRRNRRRRGGRGRNGGGDRPQGEPTAPTDQSREGGEPRTENSGRAPSEPGGGRESRGRGPRPESRGPNPGGEPRTDGEGQPAGGVGSEGSRKDRDRRRRRRGRRRSGSGGGNGGSNGGGTGGSDQGNGGGQSGQGGGGESGGGGGGNPGSGGGGHTPGGGDGAS